VTNAPQMWGEMQRQAQARREINAMLGPRRR